MRMIDIRPFACQHNYAMCCIRDSKVRVLRVLFLLVVGL